MTLADVHRFEMLLHFKFHLLPAYAHDTCSEFVTGFFLSTVYLTTLSVGQVI